MKTKNKKSKIPETDRKANQIPKLAGMLQEALKHHQKGNFDTATILYNKVLEIQPDNISAISLLGALNLQRGNHDVACMLLEKSLTLKPDNAIAHNNLGSALQASGRFQEAINSYKKAIELKQDYDEAYYNLGNTLQACNLLEEAIVIYKHALAIKPNDADIHNNLAEAFRKSGKPDEALKCYKQAAMLNPHNTEILCNLGAVFQELGNLDEAIINYKKAITLKPDNAKAHSNLGTALKKQCKLEEAVKSHHRAIALKPDYAEAYNNLGITLQSLNQLDEAVASYNRAIELKPDYAEAYNNLGITLQSLNQLDKALTSYNRAIELKRDYAEARFNKSLILLLKGNFKDGWQEYEWRLRTKDHVFKAFQQPMWDSSPLNGKTILVHTEQGLGDSIQFIRYIPMVKKQGGRVIVECQQSLCSLFRNCDGIDEIKEIVSDIEYPVQFDFHVPLLSLPGIFNVTMDSTPPNAPYIKPDPALVSQWHRTLDHDNNFKIGVVWAGNPKNKNDHKRSCSLKDFEHLTSIRGLSFYSLQKGQASVEANNPPKGMNIINLDSELNDFADTAAAIINLDLVISVDTSVAHLAGAIGKPVWTLL
ncbi:MAG: tetratricopeptide repeat protein, partial [Planctomycetota bacterium]